MAAEREEVVVDAIRSIPGAPARSPPAPPRVGLRGATSDSRSRAHDCGRRQTPPVHLAIWERAAGRRAARRTRAACTRAAAPPGRRAARVRSSGRIAPPAGCWWNGRAAPSPRLRRRERGRRAGAAQRKEGRAGKSTASSSRPRRERTSRARPRKKVCGRGPRAPGDRRRRPRLPPPAAQVAGGRKPRLLGIEQPGGGRGRGPPARWARCGGPGPPPRSPRGAAPGRPGSGSPPAINPGDRPGDRPRCRDLRLAEPQHDLVAEAGQLVLALGPAFGVALQRPIWAGPASVSGPAAPDSGGRAAALSAAFHTSAQLSGCGELADCLTAAPEGVEAARNDTAGVSSSLRRRLRRADLRSIAAREYHPIRLRGHAQNEADPASATRCAAGRRAGGRGTRGRSPGRSPGLIGRRRA